MRFNEILIYLGIGLFTLSFFVFAGLSLYLWLYIGQSLLTALWNSFVTWGVMWTFSVLITSVGFMFD